MDEPNSQIAIVKVRVKMLQKEYDYLVGQAAQRDISFTQTLRTAIGTDRYLRNEVVKGAVIVLEYPNGTLKQLTFTDEE